MIRRRPVRQLIVNLISSWVIISTLLLGFHFIGYAQESQTIDQQVNEQRIDVSLKLLLVDETLACRPNGYGYTGGCQIWTIQEVNQLISERGDQLIIAQGSVPPGEFYLGNQFFNALASYVDSGSASPKAVLIIFDFGAPQGTQGTRIPISLDTQLSKDQNHALSRPYKSTFRGGNQVWIYHERADIYYPANNVQWTLCLGSDRPSCSGGKQWIYRMQP